MITKLKNFITWRGYAAKESTQDPPSATTSVSKEPELLTYKGRQYSREELSQLEDKKLREREILGRYERVWRKAVLYVNNYETILEELNDRIALYKLVDTYGEKGYNAGVIEAAQIKDTKTYHRLLYFKKHEHKINKRYALATLNYVNTQRAIQHIMGLRTHNDDSYYIYPYGTR